MTSNFSTIRIPQRPIPLHQRAVISGSVDELMSVLFRKPRAARSPEYKAGVRASLESIVLGTRPPFPYTLGTPHADAFIAGELEGNTAWRIWASNEDFQLP